mmetsp:Transcript_102737/g.279221  ORF Transcript_102737/g.279221 Transcript_102737/m.279221 type:complete len:249 (+) Transcript_102737:94-840(+)
MWDQETSRQCCPPPENPPSAPARRHTSLLAVSLLRSTPSQRSPGCQSTSSLSRSRPRTFRRSPPRARPATNLHRDPGRAAGPPRPRAPRTSPPARSPAWHPRRQLRGSPAHVTPYPMEPPLAASSRAPELPMERHILPGVGPRPRSPPPCWPAGSTARAQRHHGHRRPRLQSLLGPRQPALRESLMLFGEGPRPRAPPYCLHMGSTGHPRQGHPSLRARLPPRSASSPSAATRRACCRSPRSGPGPGP